MPGAYDSYMYFKIWIHVKKTAQYHLKDIFSNTIYFEYIYIFYVNKYISINKISTQKNFYCRLGQTFLDWNLSKDGSRSSDSWFEVSVPIIPFIIWFFICRMVNKTDSNPIWSFCTVYNERTSPFRLDIIQWHDIEHTWWL